MKDTATEILYSKKSNFYFVFILTLNDIIDDFSYITQTKVFSKDFPLEEYAIINFKLQKLLLNLYIILPFKFTKNKEFIIVDNLFRYDEFTYLNNELKKILTEKNKDFFLFNYYFRNAFHHHVFNLDLCSYGGTDHQLDSITFEISLDEFSHRKILLMEMYSDKSILLFDMDIYTQKDNSKKREIHKLSYMVRLAKIQEVIIHIQNSFYDFISFLSKNTKNPKELEVLQYWNDKIRFFDSAK